MRQHIPNSVRNLLLLLSICGTQFAYGGNKSWTGSISTDWAIAGNWNPAGIPSDTDDVTIPSSAVNQPVLSADAHSAALTVQTGAHLSIGSFTLLTNGNIDASDIAGTTGSVQVNGTGVTIKGKFPNLTISGTANLSDTVHVTGNLIIDALLRSANLILNGKSIIVGVDFSTQNNGKLTMLNPSDVLSIGGNVIFAGAPLAGLDTAGLISVKGNFGQYYTGSNWDDFAASGTLKVILNGTSPQIIHFDNAGEFGQTSHFKDLQIANPTKVTFSTNAQVNGNFTVSASDSVDGAGTLTVVGNTSTVVNSHVTIAGLRLGGSMAVSGSFSPAITEFFGTNQTIQPGLNFKDMLITGTTVLIDTTRAAGNLTISSLTTNGNLTLNGHAMLVSGNFATQNSSGKLTMLNPSDLLSIGGNATFAGAPLAGLDTAGIISVGGNFGQYYTSSNWGSFQSGGSHRVDLNGSSPQNVHFDSPSNGSIYSYFNNLEISNPTSVTFDNTTFVNGNLTVSGPDTVQGNIFLTIAGNLTTSPGSSITVFRVWLYGSMNVGGFFSPPSIFFKGSNQVIQGGLDYQSVIVEGNASFGGSATINGGLVASNPSGVIDLNGKNVTVTGDYESSYQNYTQGGTLIMKNPSGVLRVLGSVNFDGNPTDTLLTAGTMYVGGNFRVGKNFSASGTHKVIFNGSSPQAIYQFFSPPASHFQDVELASSSELDINTNVQANGNFKVDSSAILTGTGALTVRGIFNTLAGSSVTVNSIELDSSMSVAGIFSPATTMFGGVDQIIQAGLGYRNVTVNGTASFAGTTSINGSLIANNPIGVIDLNGKDVTVTGDYTSAYQNYTQGGTLIMKNPSGMLRVLGRVNFDGNPTDTLLTAGKLYVGGNLRVGKNFSASGTHRVIFNGSSPQAINEFYSPPSSHFQDLEVANPSGLAINTSVQANGNVKVDSSALVTGTGSLVLKGTFNTLAGSSVTINGLELDSSMSIGGIFSPTNTTFGGVDQIIQAGVGYKDVTVTGRASFSGPTAINGNLIASGAPKGTVDVNGSTVAVSGNYISGYFSNIEGGTLIMRNPASVLRVQGNVTFDGNPTDTLLTAGRMYVGGNFTLNKNFTSSGTHKVVFNGSSRQTISGSYGGSSHFNDLQLDNPSGIVLASDVVANGQLISRPGLHTAAPTRGTFATTASTPDSIFGGGHSLTVSGLDVDTLTLDNVRLIDNGGTITNFNKIVFENYDSTVTQFTINHAGAPNAFAFEGLQFLTAPSTGYYISATDNLVDGNVLTINLISSVPHDGSAHTLVTGGAVVNWGINANPPPSLASVSPIVLRRGEKVNITLTGSNFIDTVTTVNIGAGIIIDSLTFMSASQIVAHASVMDSAAIGTRTVSVTKAPPGGGTAVLPNILTVGYPRPIISRIIPDSANRTQTLSFI